MDPLDIDQFLRLSAADLAHVTNLGDIVRACPCDQEEGLRARLSEFTDFHIEFLLAAYDEQRMKPPLDFLVHFIGRDSKSALRYGLIGLTRLPAIPDEILERVRDIIVTSEDHFDRNIAADTLLHFAKNHALHCRRTGGT